MMGLQPRRLVRGHGEGDRVRLAEAVRPERLDDLPGPLDDLLLVSALASLLREPRLYPSDLVGVRQRPPRVVAEGQGAAGHDRQDLDDLFVEDHHAVRLAQCGLQVRVRTAGRLPPVPGLDERIDHVGRDRPRPEQRDVDDEIVEGLGLQPGDEVALTG